MRVLVMMCASLVALMSAGSAHARENAAATFSPSGCITSELQAVHLNGREVKFNLILPAGYSDGTRRFPVLYLLHGFGGSYKDWCSLTHIVDYAKPYQEIIVMPEGGAGWYVNNSSDPKMQWEDYFIQDLIPYVDAHYRTISDRQHRAIAGLSMGGYGALFLGLKHHDLFAAVASLSGVVASANLERWDAPLVKADLHKKEYRGIVRALRSDFGPETNPARRNEDPFLLVLRITSADCPELYVSIGWGDNLLHENREFARVLSRLKLPYRYSEVPGKHEWPVWAEEIRRVLTLQAPVIGAASGANSDTH